MPEADALLEPLDWYELASQSERLGQALIRAGRLYLPTCWALFRKLSTVLETVDPTPLEVDPSAQRHASPEQVEAIIGAARAALKEANRPPDEIPLGVPPPRG